MPQDLRSHKKGTFLKRCTWNSTRYMFACCGFQRAAQGDLHGVHALLKEAKPAICYPLQFSIWLTSVYTATHIYNQYYLIAKQNFFCMSQPFLLSAEYLLLKTVQSSDMYNTSASVGFTHPRYWNSQPASNVNVTFWKIRRCLARSSDAARPLDWKASENSLAAQRSVQEMGNGFSRAGTQSSCGHRPELYRVHCWHLECLSSLAFPFDWGASHITSRVTCIYGFISTDCMHLPELRCVGQMSHCIDNI